MAQWVRCLPCKHEDLGSKSGTHVKKLDATPQTCNCSTQARARGPNWQALSPNERPCLKNQGRWRELLRKSSWGWPVTEKYVDIPAFTWVLEHERVLPPHTHPHIHTHITNPTSSHIYRSHPYPYTCTYTLNPHTQSIHTHSHTLTHTYTIHTHPPTPTHSHTHTKKKFSNSGLRKAGRRSWKHSAFICSSQNLKGDCCCGHVTKPSLLSPLTQTENTLSRVEQELSLFG